MFQEDQIINEMHPIGFKEEGMRRRAMILFIAVLFAVAELATAEKLPFDAVCEHIQLKETLFRINLECSNRPFYWERDSAPEIVSNIMTVHAAGIVLARGYQYFRILESWSTRGALAASEKHRRTMLIRLTNDPNDIEAQWIIDTVAPSLLPSSAGQKGEGSPSGTEDKSKKDR